MRSQLSYAFVNRRPVLPGHVLVSPIREAQRFSDLTPSEVSDLFQTVQIVSHAIEKHYGGQALTISIQDGQAAGQTIKHVHVHILPRKPGDFEKNDDIYDKLEHHDKDVKPTDWRTDQDMESEAAILRQYFP